MSNVGHDISCDAFKVQINAFFQLYVEEVASTQNYNKSSARSLYLLQRAKGAGTFYADLHESLQR